MCVLGPRRGWEEILDPLKLELSVTMSLHAAFKESNLGPQQRQPVIITVESFLQTLDAFSYNYIFLYNNEFWLLAFSVSASYYPDAYWRTWFYNLLYYQYWFSESYPGVYQWLWWPFSWEVFFFLLLWQKDKHLGVSIKCSLGWALYSISQIANSGGVEGEFGLPNISRQGNFLG